MHLNDALAREPRITPVPLFHEQSAGIAAEYYARSDESPFGVCMVTTGPGVTNAITALMGAWIESVPVLFVSGQAKTGSLVAESGLRQIGVQEVETLKLVSAFTKYAISLTDETDVTYELEKSLDIMSSGRPGPVWLEVPLDIQPKKCISFERKNYERLSSSPRSNDLDLVIQLLESAKKPLLYLGHGVRLDGISSVVPMIDHLNIPTVTTWNALDLLPFDHELNFGRPGVVAKRSANIILQAADLVICIGSSLNLILTAYAPESFAKNAKKIIFNIDKAELNKNAVAADCLIEMSASEALSFLTEKYQAASVNDWIHWCSNIRQIFANEIFQTNEVDTELSHYIAVKALSDGLPAGIPIVTGSSGLAIESFYVAFENKESQRVLHTSGLGSMGYCVPAAIGFLNAQNCNKLVCVEGDGSLLMNLQDVPRLFSFGTQVCLIIFNNGGYASIRATQNGYFEGRYLGTGPEADINFPSIESIANFGGVRHVTADSYKVLIEHLSDFSLGGDSSLIIDVQVKKDEVLFPKCSPYYDDNGTLLSMPMEDMSPLLPISQLKSIMGNISAASAAARSLKDL